MDVWDNLMIRVCKSESVTLSKLRRVFARRCALKPEHVRKLPGYMAHSKFNRT